MIRALAIIVPLVYGAALIFIADTAIRAYNEACQEGCYYGRQ